MKSEFLTYNDIYTDIMNKIFVNDGSPKRTFTIPLNVIAVDGYHVKKCLVFIIKKLRDRQIEVKYNPPNKLVVTIPDNLRQRRKISKKSVKIDDPSIRNIIYNVQRYQC